MTRPTRRPFRTGGAAVVACLVVASPLLAACSAGSEDESANPAPTAEPTPTLGQAGSPEPTGPQVTEPTLPAAARGSSVRSAKAFVRHYIDLLNYAMVTGDTRAFRAVSAPMRRMQTVRGSLREDRVCWRLSAD